MGEYKSGTPYDVTTTTETKLQISCAGWYAIRNTGLFSVNISTNGDSIPVGGFIVAWFDNDEPVYGLGVGGASSLLVSFYGNHKPILSDTMTLNTGDLEIGAVEIKNATNDDRVNVELDITKNALYVQSESMNAILDKGAASAGGAATLTDAAKKWDIDIFTRHMIRVISGTGIQQTRRILSNTASIITVLNAWTTAPVAGDKYQIISLPDGAASTKDVNLVQVNGTAQTGSDWTLLLTAITNAINGWPKVYALKNGSYFRDNVIWNLLDANIAKATTIATGCQPWLSAVRITRDVSAGTEHTTMTVAIYEDDAGGALLRRLIYYNPTLPIAAGLGTVLNTVLLPQVPGSQDNKLYVVLTPAGGDATTVATYNVTVKYEKGLYF